MNIQFMNSVLKLLVAPVSTEKIEFGFMIDMQMSDVWVLALKGYQTGIFETNFSLSPQLAEKCFFFIFLSSLAEN